MNFKMFIKKNNIPKELMDFLGEMKLRCISINHTSGDLVYNVAGKYILKISTNKERIKREIKVNEYLHNKLPVSKNLFFIEDEKYAYYIKTRLIGTSLVSKTYINNPHRLIKLLSKALKMIHSIDIRDCDILSNYSNGNAFIHGDFCLPNILVKGNKIVGFIDVEAAGIGDPWADYAWCIWSLEYNLKSSKYRDALLEELNIEFDREKYNRYIDICA